MSEVSLGRLYFLRATYLLILVGLGLTIWPVLLGHAKPWSLYHSVVCSVLTAVSLLAALGIRYPLKMLPLLLFELVWKTIWLAAIALPAWYAGQLDPKLHETVKACLMGLVIFPVAIPWRHVFASFVKAPGDRWK